MVDHGTDSGTTTSGDHDPPNDYLDDAETEMRATSLTTSWSGDQPMLVSSSCSSSGSSVSGSMAPSSSASSASSSSLSFASAVASRSAFSTDSCSRSTSLLTLESRSILESTTETDEEDDDNEGEDDSTAAPSFEQTTDQISTNPDTSSSRTRSSLDIDLDLDLNYVRRLVRLGKSAGLRYRRELPTNVTNSDIYVSVDIDEKLDHGEFGLTMRSSIQNDLRTVFTADSGSAEFFLCVVIVCLSDGSLFCSLSQRNGVLGLTEIGCVWRLFAADDLTVYDGGLVVKSDDVSEKASIFDLSVPTGARGRQVLLGEVCSSVADEIISRIADANDSLRCEF